MDDAYPVLIIGGGIHGTIISLALSQYLPRGYHRVIDPHEQPLRQWMRNCRACGLRYLRSPGAHQLSVDSQSLIRFSRATSTAAAALAETAASVDTDALTETAPAPADSAMPARGQEFIPRYNRPHIALFMRHAQSLIEGYDLGSARIRAHCRRIDIADDHVSVHTDRRTLTARRVLLCTGMTGQLHYPAWAAPFVAADPSTAEAAKHPARPTDLRAITHVFSDRFRLADYRDSRRVVIIGGGITALQLALSLAGGGQANSDGNAPRSDGRRTRTGREIIVLSRHPLRYADFDSDPCYFGPKCLREFDALSDPQRRQEKITAARNRASIPSDIAALFHAQCAVSADRGDINSDTRGGDAHVSGVTADHARAGDGIADDAHATPRANTTHAALRADHARANTARRRSTVGPAACRLIIDEVAEASGSATSRWQLRLASGAMLNADDVILATGFEASAMKNPLIADLCQRYNLPCSPDGSPMTDRQLRWHPRVLLSGAYAALTVGPAAGNIIGAHLALRRMMPLLLERQYKAEYAWKSLYTAVGPPVATTMHHHGA